MIEFKLTTVSTPNGRVVSAQNFIITAGADGIDATDSLGRVLLQQFLKRLRHQPLASRAAVVRCDDVLVADRREAIGPEEHVLVACALNRDDSDSRLLERMGDRVNRRRSDAAGPP